MFTKTAFTTLFILAAQGAWAQCPDITSQATYGATSSVTVSSATRATITDPAGAFQGVTILSCAEATVGPSATVNIDTGGIATLSGNAASRAVATVIGSATIQNPIFASINVLSRDPEIYGATNVDVVVAPSASALVIGQDIHVRAEGGSIFINMLVASGDGSLDIGGEFSTGVFQYEGQSTEDIKVRGYARARLGLFGRLYGAMVYDGAFGQLFDRGLACTAAERATCTAYDSSQTVVAAGDGYAEATGGTSNVVRVSAMGSGRVGGSGNSGAVESGGTLRVQETARAVVRSGGLATIFEGVSDVSVSSGATATMYERSEVTAAPGAFLRAGALTTIESVREGNDGLTVFQARTLAASGAGLEQRNARRAQPTGRCGIASELCPNLRGIFGCVDTQTDIFNCGGCALASGAGRDCTQLYDGSVACIRGECVAL